MSASASVPVRRRRPSSTRGQASVLTLAALVLGLAVCFLALTAGRAAVERARAQRVADTAALAGALRLARDPLDRRGALVVARRIVEAAGDDAVRVHLEHDTVEVRVRRRPVRLRLPTLFGGGATVLAVQAVARAAPGAPPAPPPLPVEAGAGGGVSLGPPAALDEPGSAGPGDPAPDVGVVETGPGTTVEARVRPSPAAGPSDPGGPDRRDGGAGGDAAPPGLELPETPDAVPDWVPPVYRAAFAAAAAREGLPVVLLAAQAEAESGFRADAVSSAGAVGIAQFMPATWAGTWNPWRLRSPRDPDAAIPAQARYLRRLLDDHGGDVRVALAAYNAGSARARGSPSGWPAETRAYVARILARVAGGGSGVAPVWPVDWGPSAGARLVG